MRVFGSLLVMALSLSGCVGTAEDADGAPEESALRTGRLLPTSSVERSADPTLLAVVHHIEAKGGKGGWFRSALPWEGAKREPYYLLRTVPPNADVESPMLLLRLEHSRAALAEAVRGGTPIVLGKIPPEFQAAAATFTELPITRDALAAGGINGRKSILFLPPETLKTTFAHELQHWNDFEDASFHPRFAAMAEPLLEASYLSDEDKLDLEQIVFELRGHGMGERQAREDLANGNPTFYRGGIPVPDAERARAYEGDAANQVNVFLSAYRPC